MYCVGDWKIRNLKLILLLKDYINVFKIFLTVVIWKVSIAAVTSLVPTGPAVVKDSKSNLSVQTPVRILNLVLD